MLFGNAQRKPQGLFGGFAQGAQPQMPQADPMGGIGMGMQQALQQAPPQMMGQGAEQFAQDQSPKKPGINWWGVVADALAGAAGREGPYAAQMQARKQQEYAAQQAQAQREASMQDWRTKLDYERANPAAHQPDDFERSLIGGGVLPGTPEWAEANRQRSQNFTDPIVNVQTPTGYYSGPRSGLAAAMQGANGGQQPVGGLTPVGKLKPLGGVSGQPAGGGFPVGANSLDRITVQAESAGNPNAVSPKGARGLWQVMPETARKPGFGITPSNGSQADDARVGSEYRRKMEARYGGDPAKMWAAYNWGPGNLDNALEKHGNNWLQHAPAETRNYVTRNMRALRGYK